MSRTEGSIVMRTSRGTYWNLELTVGVAKDGNVMPRSHGLATLTPSWVGFDGAALCPIDAVSSSFFGA